jgi:hypothetical protein
MEPRGFIVIFITACRLNLRDPDESSTHRAIYVYVP